MRAPVLPALVALIIGGASAVVQGPLPGDVVVTQAGQALLGGGPGWAEWLTDTAKAPLLLGTLVLAGALAWRVTGWRGALAVPLAYGFAFAADKALRAALFVPRPDPAMVAVAAPSASSGLPSTFGLVYGAVFGVVLLASGPARRARLARIIAAVLLVAGITARIVLGGHWGSQMLASTALGILAAWAALANTRRLARK
jgi:membrane-associated phospholipid phosphatase